MIKEGYEFKYYILNIEMAKPMSLSETMREAYFIPDHKLVFSFATSCFDSTWSLRTGKLEPYYPDLPACKADCEVVKRKLKAFQVTDMGKDEMYNLVEDPSNVETNSAMTNIKIRLRDHPEELYLIFYILAGHGMSSAGRQMLLINEFDKSRGFYK